MMLSVIIIWGVETTEHTMVATALETKSSAKFVPSLVNPAAAFTLFMRDRVDSSTAKFMAPWGMERRNWAPAPRLRTLRTDASRGMDWPDW